MRRTDLCRGWTFRVWGVPGDTPVTLPHDYSQQLPRSPQSRSGSAGGWFEGADIIYDRELDVTEDMLSERVMLEFDGVLPNAEVYLDDTLIARQPYGYVSFRADLTPHLRKGTRKIRVNVFGGALPNSRWYTGTGICRPVYLLRGNRACILPDGLYAVTETDENGNWTLEARVSLSPESVSEKRIVRLSVTDASGKRVFSAEQRGEGEEIVFRGAVPEARAWSPEHPALYVLSAELREGEAVLDREEKRFGFRDVRLDAEKGLLLNLRPVKLRGGCVHHDNGILGAVSLPESEYEKARRLKEFGYNAVRCAHNPPAPAFLDACDEVGLMVMDEFADMWNIGKNPYDYHLVFRDRWKQDLAAMILRDRNHPSVILWSVGNEIPERDGSGNGYELCREMCALVRALDKTRPVTAALNNVGKRRLDMLDANVQKDDPDSIDYFGLLTERFLQPLDAAGYNYLSRRYEKDLASWPRRFILGTESVAREAAQCWRKTLSHPRIIGDFAWAAMDYLGEAGIGHVWRRPEDGSGFFEKWPWRQANCADIDLCGEKTPAGHYRQAVWGTLDKPFIAVQHPAHFHEDGDVSYWGWPERYSAWDYPGFEGKPISVSVYSSGKRVTLRLNGQAVASAPCVDCVASFDLVYAPGLLEAEDDRGGISALRTPGEAAAIRPEASVRGRLIMLTAGITDRDGVPCRFDRREISFAVEGGELLAAGSADPASEEGFRAGKARAWKGRATAAVLRTDRHLSVAVTSPGLPPALWEIRV